MSSNCFYSSLWIGIVVSSISLVSFSSAAPNYSWDLRSDYAFAPVKMTESEVTSTMKARMDRVDAEYNFSRTVPNGSGLTMGQMQDINDIVYGKYAIVRDVQTGLVTGRTILIDDENDYGDETTNPNEPAGFNSDWLPDILIITSYYSNCSTDQKAAIEQAYQDMVELWLNAGYIPGYTGASNHISGGYVWRNYGYKCLRMSHTLPDETKNLLALSVIYYSGGSGLLESETHPFGSTDYYHNVFHTMFRAISCLTDDAFKWQLLQTIRHQLDKTIIGTQGDNCLITVDGGIIHHTGHHISYASYSYLNMIKPHRILSQAGFNSTLTPEVIKRFRQAALSWAWADTNGDFSIHYQMRISHPSSAISGSKDIGNTVQFLEGAAELTAAFNHGNSSQINNDLEMAYPAIVKAGQGSNSLPGQWRNIQLPSLSMEQETNWYMLSGHNTFQTNGSAFHRRDKWLASIRGAHTYRRGGEGYDTMGMPDHHHQQSLRGSLLLITEGLYGRAANSADSGYFFQGWDHNYYPNVTNRMVDLIDHLYWRRPAYFSGASTKTGGANLFDNGVWFYVPSDGSHRKSAFFFDNRITLVTSDITYSNNGQSVVTGLIQHGHPDFENNPITLDGTVHFDTGQWELAAGGDHKLIDINGNGYYIHPNPATPSIKAQRSVQGWPYALSDYYIGPGNMPGYTYDDEFAEDVDAGKFNDTTGNYSKVYFDHGNNPTNDSIVYSVLVKPDAGEMDSFVSNLKNPGSEPLTLETSGNRHLLYDISTNTYAATLFTDNQTINQGGFVSASRLGAYMWQNDGSSLRFSCGSSHMEDTSPFVAVFDGRWYKHVEYDTEFVSCIFDREYDTTTVTLQYRQFARQGLVLTSEDFIHASTNLFDFAVLASNWLNTDCNECNGADFNTDGNVDIQDLYRLVELWLTETH